MSKNDSRKNVRIDTRKVNQFALSVMNDLDATAHCALAYIGDILGFYRAMANAEDNSVTSEELAKVTRTNERYIRDWLAEQASKHYITFDPSTGKYTLPEEHAIVLANETSDSYLAGGFQLLISILRQQPRITELFRTGEGLEWADHDMGVFEGQARINGTQYRANLTTKWIPSLLHVENKLLSDEGADVADIGCGYGISTVIMAKAYPNSRFVGVDSHALSIEVARKRAAEQGLDDSRLRFVTAKAESFPRYDGYDLVTFFDSFHDMGNPYAVAKHARDVLSQDGTLMLAEMASSDKVEENIDSPIGTNGYAGSIFVCLPTALSQMKKATYFDRTREELNALPLGGMPGEKTLERLLRTCGFTKFRCALRDEFNMILEAKI